MNPNNQRSLLNKFDTTKQPNFGSNYQTPNASHPNPYGNPELIMRHNVAGMSEYSHGIPYESSGPFYNQIPGESKYPMNAFPPQLDNKVRNEDYQFSFNTKLPQVPTEPVKRFVEPGAQLNQSNPAAQSFKQKLLEKYGKNSESKRQNFDTINDSGGFSQESTASTFHASKLGNTFSVDHSNESMYPVPEKSWLKNDQSADINATKILADDSKDSKPPANPNEEIMGAIIKNQINCVSLLNEIGSKVKKRVDYTIKEIPMAKIKVFECTCVFEKQNIGFGKGNSKQAAKTDAAIEGVRTLLTKDEYTYEKAHITLSVQKLTGVGTQASTTSIQASVLAPDVVQDTVSKVRNLQEGGEPDHSQIGKSQAQAEAEALMNDSALYELNLIAKECFIEPRWIMSPPGGPNGDFEAQVIFDKLVATGKGRKKLDAKREAALKIIQQIRSNKELNEKYNPKSKKKSSRDDGIPEIAKNDQAKLFFESCIDPRSLQVFENNSAVWKDDLTLDTNFDNYLSKVLEKQEVDEDSLDVLHEFFKQVADLTNMATSNPKQVLLDAPKHLADYTSEASLVPIGSFALDCMRKDNLSLDALLVFQETKRISEKELLDLYRYSLGEGQKINLQQNPQLNKMQFSVETSDIGDYVLVAANSRSGRLTLQIQVANLTNDAAKKHESTIMHVKRIYDCLEESDKLSKFRNLMTLIRIWRARNNLVLLPTELLDAILLNEFLNNKTGNNAGYLMNCLITMSTEETFQAALNKCGSFYARLYKDMPSKFKWTISSKCSQSLEAICKESFDESGFY